MVGGLGAQVHDVAVDPGSGTFYISDVTHDTVVSAKIDYPLPISIFPGNEAAEIGSVRGLALDDANKRLFVTTWESSPVGGLWRIDLAGPSRTHIVSGLSFVHDVAYDPVDSKVYWNADLGDGPTPTGKIQRANPDGTGTEDLLTGLPGQVRGLDLDTVNRRIYWTDMSNGQIRRSNLDGTGAETVLSGLSNPHDVAVDPVAGRIYWVESTADGTEHTAAIRGAGLDGSSPFDVVTGLHQRTRDLTVVYHDDLYLFEDGFESGDVSTWTSAVP